MPDLADAAQQLDDVVIDQIEMIRARSTVLEVQATGFCLSCDAEVSNDSRWCNAECRDRWADERKHREKLQAQARL
jgi:predicted nucleic acid-binding Zn ribbon protein